jgi:hypothetical protein
MAGVAGEHRQPAEHQADLHGAAADLPAAAAGQERLRQRGTRGSPAGPASKALLPGVTLM